MDNLPTAIPPKKAQLNVDVAQDLRKRIRLAACKKDETQQDWVVAAIMARLEREEAEDRAVAA